jgi:methionine sulfoxide reductase heme-binding subunit
VYVAAAAGVLHYFWLVKKDIHYPLIYGVILIVLLTSRLWWAADRARARRSLIRKVEAKPAA